VEPPFFTTGAPPSVTSGANDGDVNLTTKLIHGSCPSESHLRKRNQQGTIMHIAKAAVEHRANTAATTFRNSIIDVSMTCDYRYPRL
jgi:hypothetical protein